MNGDPTLRWIVTVLFGVSVATYIYTLVAQRDRSTSTVSHVLHLAMATAMILMAWSIDMAVPVIVPMIFFVLTGAWFVRAAGQISSTVGVRLTNSYYAVMTAAMVWMYAVMSGYLPRQTTHPPSDSLAMNMPEMEMPGHELSSAPAGSGWITTVNWIAALGFAVVALFWSCRCAARRKSTHLEPLYQACAAAGTAMMLFAQL
ncbi:DUF5134 domain-containing protein [Mycobacterium montefiorense]|uniref:DUF5134 domain-containing protein n=1 Tax=Mycobacterium montefiorense TaxID=154654 RepID=A0AA37PLG9_9MYCO|nr:DUF5134 domain-containing protein [Mycobacterium montefiorense]GBG36978.1 hypothetical protein MmonteBS_13500 [Mycobacterium montefiorense]GKU32885.1 hypothetical protein NJB14191_02320 [Mycobacterium montefiorense]GKU42562.1 hypothetical protein NJB14192_45450 [Mycobacterium montefiorense]GKU48281.1 hypothetical protein NJB14194_48960 [Mycobacterium montefiorense]GKU50783.1 hypothetical protein NJB14195_20290 [Mycobacterium montefiorense]